METFGFLSLLPPVAAILLAILTRHVILSLSVGIWLGWTILNYGNPFLGFAGAVNAFIQLFTDTGNSKIIFFCIMVGALISLTQASRGVDGFVEWITKRGIARNQRRAQLLAWLVGVIIFVESSISCLIVGAVSRPLFDKLKLSREKLAYICDSTSAPVCILLPFNGWGAFLIGLLAAQNIEAPFSLVLKSIPYNFYSILAVLLPLGFILRDSNLRPMSLAEKRTQAGNLFWKDSVPLISEEVTHSSGDSSIKALARNLLIPVFMLVVAMPVTLYVTGQGNLMKGSGSTAVFWSVLIAILASLLLYQIQGILKLGDSIDIAFKGMGALLPLGVIVALAFCLGDLCKLLGTGVYTATVTKAWLTPKLLPALLFLIGCFISFATGTSWGTFATLIPIGIPMGMELGSNLPLVLGAILSGGVFGDHTSPISDTTIVSAMASACDLTDHTKTQLPYGLLALGISFFLFLLLGFFSA